MVNINGPINYCCLKGVIDGVEKNITLFMDKHYKLDEQTRCDTFDSIDISNYMYKEIKNSKKQLDFFLEITLDEIKSERTNKRDIYIKELFEMFKSEFVVEKINKTDVVRYSKSNPNVRLHFLDIRDLMDMSDVRYIIREKILKKFNVLLSTTNKEQKKNISLKILNYFDKIYAKLNKLTDDKDKIIKSNLNKVFDSDKQKYSINKAINKCENKKLKHNLIKFLNDNYDNTMYNLNIVVNKNIKEVLENIEEYENNKIKEIYEYMEFVEEAIIDLYGLFVDCYLLRRVLDKNYIVNSIIYTGIQHSIHYIYFLHKYYNFEIIKMHYVEKSLDMMLKQIKESHFVFEIYKYILSNKKYPQCIPYNPMFGGNPYMEYLKDKVGDKKTCVKLF